MLFYKHHLILYQFLNFELLLLIKFKLFCICFFELMLGQLVMYVKCMSCSYDIMYLNLGLCSRMLGNFSQLKRIVCALLKNHFGLKRLGQHRYSLFIALIIWILVLFSLVKLNLSSIKLFLLLIHYALLFFHRPVLSQYIW